MCSQSLCGTSKHEQEEDPMAIITVSRGTFSCGQKLAKRVAERLGYRCISREVLAKAAAEYGAPEPKLFEALSKKPWILERLTHERERYLSYIRAALLKEVRDENVVYHGHAGHLLLKGVPHIFRVRVIANMEIRIEAAMDRHGFSREEAIEYIRKVDRERALWTKFLYHVDWHDPSLYDVVFNLDEISLEDCCDVICHLTNTETYKMSMQSRKIMDDLVLGTHLRALIATDKSISDGNLDVVADGGFVTVAGTVGSIGDADKIRVMLRKTPGVEEIDSKMRVRLPTWSLDN
jgi:cytidylate kinase